MEPLNLYFDFRDIFRAPRLALSVKKILIFLKANLFGFAIYWIFTYLALLLSGIGLSDAFNNLGLYPCIYAAENVSVFPRIIYWLGILIWIITNFFACTAVSRITYKQLKGDEFYSIADAKKFVKNNRYPIVLSWVSILLIAAFFLLVAAIFALMGKIPIIGELLFAILYIIYFFGAVFTVYTLIVFLVSFIYSPAIVATMEEDTMGTVFQSYSTAWSQPWRIVLYHLILLPILFIAIAILKWFWLSGYKLINIIFGFNWFMGNKLERVVGWATDLVNPRIFSCGLLKTSLSDNSGQAVLSLQDGTLLSTTEYIAGTLIAIILFILFMSVISYGLSILSVGETLMFTIFKKKSNEENLLLRNDDDDAENDHVLDEPDNVNDAKIQEYSSE